MTQSMQQLLKQLFRVDTLEEVPRERLEDLIEEYPSFGVARYLLSRKLGAENASTFKEETQKTNLYFSNPFWLHWLLQNPGEEKVPEKSRLAAFSKTAPAPVPASELSPTVPEDKEIREESEPIEGNEESNDDLHDSSNGIVATALEQVNEVREAEPEEPEQKETTVPSITEKTTEEPLNFAAEGNPVLIPEETAGLHQPESPVLTEEEPDQEYPLMAEETPHYGEAAPLSTPEPGFFHEEIISGGAVNENQPVSPIPQETQTAGGTIPQAPKAFDFTLSPVTDPLTDSPMVFESFHTIDYFASQGIRLRLDENPTDRLGKQVKSFTDWLKVMRRLPQKNAEIIPDIAAESKIQAIAAHSIEGKEVLTETMAEVLAKQGMKEKAAEVYRKLSLLNPDKRAYFATKIEQLKTF